MSAPDLDALRKRLEDLKAREAELAPATAEKESIEAELAEVRRAQHEKLPKGKLPLLDTLEIATPCTQAWDAMTPLTDDWMIRFCLGCQKNVYDLSKMTRDEAEDFVRASEGTACVRLYKRADGTVINADCPEGETRKKRRLLTVAAGVTAGVAAGIAAILSLEAPAPSCPYATPNAPPDPSAIRDQVVHATMGDMAPARPEATQVVQGGFHVPPPEPTHHTKTMGCDPHDPTCGALP